MSYIRENQTEGCRHGFNEESDLVEDEDRPVRRKKKKKISRELRRQKEWRINFMQMAQDFGDGGDNPFGDD